MRLKKLHEMGGIYFDWDVSAQLRIAPHPTAHRAHSRSWTVDSGPTRAAVRANRLCRLGYAYGGARVAQPAHGSVKGHT